MRSEKYNMTTITGSTRINAPKAHVWELIADLGAVANFHPFATGSHYTSQQKTGDGASRICEFGPKLTLEETAVEWREGEMYTVAVDFIKGTKPPINDMRGSMALRADGDATIATITINYQPRFGIIGQIMDRVMIQPQYRKILPAVMQGLKHHAETGEVVDENLLKRISVVAQAA